MVLSSTQPNSWDSQVCSVYFNYGFGLGEFFCPFCEDGFLVERSLFGLYFRD